MKKLRTLKSFQIFKTEIKISKTFKARQTGGESSDKEEDNSQIHRSCTGVKAIFKVGLKLALTTVQDL